MQQIFLRTICWFAPLLLIGQAVLADTTQIKIHNRTGFTCTVNNTDYPKHCKATPETAAKITIYKSNKGEDVLDTVLPGENKTLPTSPGLMPGMVEVFAKIDGSGGDQSIQVYSLNSSISKSLYFYKLDNSYEDFIGGCRGMRCAPHSR